MRPDIRKSMTLLRFLLGFLICAVSLGAAEDTPRIVAENALRAWENRDAASLLGLAHPELKSHVHDARITKQFLKEKGRSVQLDQVNDETAFALLCEALTALLPARDPQREYFDLYVSEHHLGNRAFVIFDSGWRNRSDAAQSYHMRSTVVLEQKNGEWLFLWSPAVNLNVDLTWDPRREPSTETIEPEQVPSKPVPVTSGRRK
jgi:hypothetical protein